MSKYIILNVGEGNFEDGFSVNFVIPSQSGKAPEIISGNFPGYPPLAEAQRDWQSAYNGFAIRLRNCRKARAIASDLPPSDSSINPRQAAQALRDALRQWSSQNATALLRLQIREHIHNEPVHLILETQNPEFQRLPLHLWELIADSMQGTLTLRRPSRPIPVAPLNTPVKILAVLGNDEGIDIQTDLEILKQLPGAQVTELTSTATSTVTRRRLSQKLRDGRWDILFFAGHSFLRQFQFGSSEDASTLFPDELESPLREAIQNGLRLAIFNSCDGLELANDLLRIGVPYVVAMRGSIPDPVAHEFLKYFGKSFFEGTSLHLAIRYACRRLEDIQDEFPGASWLPILCQNSGAPVEFKVLRKRIPWKKLLVAASILGLTFGIYQIIALGLKGGSSINPGYSSLGENSLLDANALSGDDKNSKCLDSYSEKEDGMTAFKLGRFKEAEEKFGTFLSKCPDDPETKIYRNNAQALNNTRNSINQNPLSKGLTLLVPFLSSMLPILDSKTFTIPVVVPGGNSDITKELLRGLPKVQEKVNNEYGGINGKKLLLQIVNGYGLKKIYDPAETQRVAREIAQDPETVAVIGPYSSAATEIFGKEVSREKLTVIAPTSTAVRKSKDRPNGLDLSENVLRTSLTDATAASRIAKDIQDSGKSRLIIAYGGDNYSNSFKDEVERIAASYNVQIVHTCDFFNQNESAQSCLSYGRADSLLWIPPANTTSQVIDIIRVNAQKGLTHLPVWAGDSAYGQSVTQRLGNDADGMKVFISWHSEINTDSHTGFAKNEGVNFRTVMSTDALQAIVRGLQAMGSSPNRQGLNGVLLAPGFEAKRFFGEGSIRFFKREEPAIGKDGTGVGNRYPDKALGAIVELKCSKDVSKGLTCIYVKP